ncbi:MAG: amino acid adenylation domain-containing protein [Clostridia bacterium]|nr:amino acid adenylation domain-containing protein [Clostridia bacterium]
MSFDQFSQNIFLTSGEFEEERKYWNEKLKGEITMSAFPASSYATEEHETKKAYVYSNISTSTSEKLVSMTRNSHYGMYMFLLAAFEYLLYRYTGNEDIVVGMPAFKSDTEATSTKNILLLRSIVDGKAAFKDFLLEIKKTVTEADRYSNFPYSKISGLINPERGNESNPYVKTMVLMEEIHDTNMLEDTDTDLIFSFSVKEKLVKLNMEYNPALYGRNMMQQIIEQFSNILDTVTQDPKINLADINILSEKDSHRILYELNNTQASYPEEKTIHLLFEEQAGRKPDNTAVIFRDDKILYKELNEKSNQLARKLREHGACPDKVIAIMAERSIEMIIGMLAVLKAGGAYLPIDPDYPEERISYMLEDSGTEILLTYNTNNAVQLALGSDKNIKVIDLCEESLFSGDCSNLSAVNKPTDLAYIIYTSGTTGKSKGVMIEHRNVVRLMFNDKMQFDFSDTDVWTMFHSFCFDFSVWEIYGALLYGGKLVIVSKQSAQDPGEYLRLLKKNTVTILNQTPTAFYSLMNEELKSDDQSLAIRYVVFGGEALHPLMLKKWREKYPETKLINMYGITETTVHVTYKEISEKEIEMGISNIGKPIPTLTVYIMDKHLRLLPVGAIGELCVGGDGVGRGYLNRPELTKERFVENPYKKGERLYRSGDLAKLLPDGDMEYYGRIDHQVKIRGHRIELGEIESVILKYGPVQEAVAVVGEDTNKNKYICLYYVSMESLSVSELRGYLAGKLPGYMIPAYFVHMDKIPVTSNNKVDRKSLPKPESCICAEVEYEAPRNEIEEKLLDIWREVLEIGDTGINGNFFNLGGDSIKAISLINKVNRGLGTSILIKDIYMNQTIKELGEFIKTTDWQVREDNLGIGLSAIEEIKNKVLENEKQVSKLPEGYEDFYPLSPIQQGMVFFTRLMPEEPIYHDQFPYLIKFGNLDLRVFNAAVRILADKHQILRTTFDLENFSEPLQIVHSVDSGIIPEIKIDDISYLSNKDQEKKISQYMEDELKDKFRFDNDLLWRLRIFRLDETNYCMILSCQHAILDGWSVASLMSELLEIFNRLVKGDKYENQKLMSSYKDYVAMCISRKASERVRDYWKNILKGYTRNKLPFNFAGKKIRSLTGSRILSADLNPELLKTLERKAKEYNCTVKDICLAAHVYLLGLISSESDIITGVVTHDRPTIEDSEKILGCFLNTMPLRIKVENVVNKYGIIDTVKKSLREMKANELFLADIAGIIGENGTSGNPIFDTLHNFTDFHVLKNVEQSDMVKDSDRNIQINSNEMTNTLFDLEVSKTLDSLYLQIKYSQNFFHDEDMQMAFDLYVRILEEFGYGNDECLRSEKLITPEQIKEIAYDFNDTKVEYAREKTMHMLFEEQAAKTPENVALVMGDKQLTYRELNEKANQLARVLLEKGVKNGENIALITQRSFEMIIGMFGILKCGCAYVPIDPGYPLARQEYIAKNSKVTAVVVDREYDISHENVIKINFEEMSRFTCSNLDIKKDSRDLAYVIYTSGSTGMPKGVMIEHHSAVNLISWVNKEFSVNENDSLLFITSMCFDLSVYDIFGILASGGRVVIAKREQVQNPDELKQLLTENRITFWDSVPSTMNYLVNSLEGNNEDYVQEQLRLVFMSGDWIPVRLPEKIKRYFPNARPISLGGATEGTVWSIYYPILYVDKNQTSIPYGKPIDNNYFYILDDNMNVVPRGVAGELYIGGVGVARGYMNDEERTKASFVKNKLLESEMMYKTGDLGRMLPDGNIEFLGRKDHQVKIRGFRVELGEIENQLSKHISVKECVVVDRADTQGTKYLCAYLVSDNDLSASELKEFLSASLPDYMIPTHFTLIEKIPLTDNGKIDRKALPEPDAYMNTGVKYAAPRNEIETKLVDIWQEVLHLDRVGITDSFSELGGDSILIIKLQVEMGKNGMPIKIQDIYQNETIEELALFIANREQTDANIGDSKKSQEVREKGGEHNTKPLHLKSRNAKIISSITENTDSYTMKELSCFYKPWAILYASYKPEYFDLFLFYTSYYSTFMAEGWFTDINDPDAAFIDFGNKLLREKFGLYIETVEFNGEEDFHKNIKEEIDKGTRILIPGDQFYINYYEDYRKKHHGHYFIIKGYDAEREIYYILDNMHVRGGTSITYENFTMDFSKMYEVGWNFFTYLVQKGQKPSFWALRQLKNTGSYDYINLLEEHCKFLNRINSGETDIVKHLEHEALKSLEMFGNNYTVDDIEFLVRILNFKSVYYDLLFKFLRRAKAAEESVEKLQALKGLLSEKWNDVRTAIIQKIISADSNYDEIKALIENCISKEREFRDIYIEIISALNLEKSANKAGCSDIEFVERNSNKALIIRDDNKIQIIHSSENIYNTWVLQDAAAQLLVYTPDDIGFSIEARVTTDTPTESFFNSGIVLRMEDESKYFYGSEKGMIIEVICPEMGDDYSVYARRDLNKDLYLKVERTSEEYIFYSKLNRYDNWREEYTMKTTQKTSSFGLFSRTWDSINHKTEFSDINISIKNSRGL